MTQGDIIGQNHSNLLFSAIQKAGLSQRGRRTWSPSTRHYEPPWYYQVLASLEATLQKVHICHYQFPPQVLKEDKSYSVSIEATYISGFVFVIIIRRKATLV